MRAPQQPRAHPQKRPREDDEPRIRRVIVTQITRDVKEVSDASETQRQLDAHAVGERAGEEAENRKGRVHGDVGIVGDGGAELTTASESVDGVEHARAHEADQGDKDKLETWGSVGWNRQRADAVGAVFPPRLESSGGSLLVVCAGLGLIGGGRSIAVDGSRGHLLVSSVSHYAGGERGGVNQS